MDAGRDIRDLEEALTHCRAGLTAIEAAHGAASSGESVYPTHLYLATVELAHTIETAMRVALRNQ